MMTMKRTLKIGSFLNTAGILLVIGFTIRLGADYYKIQKGINSAPFYLFILERSLEFLLPGIICFAAAVYIKKHNHIK
jgi:hypothetical protein